MQTIQFISPEETIIVRHPVLRDGKPKDSCIFEGDHLPTTFHLGFFEENTLLGVVTLLEKGYKETEGKGFQLRGMAVLTGQQGKNIGKQLVERAEEEVLLKGGAYVWMNARIKAVGFYEKQGYSIVSELFDIPLVGDHYTMLKKIQK